jgi:hypothetical protein
MNRGDDKKYSQSATVFMKNKSQSVFFHFHNSRRKKSFKIKTVKQCINEAVI